jgi:hypothetical protein
MDYSGTGYRYWRALVIVVIYFGLHKKLEFLDELGKNQFLNKGSVPWRLCG